MLMFKVAFSLFFQYEPISLQYSWLSAEQPIRFGLGVVYVSLGIPNIIEDNSDVNMTYYYPWETQNIVSEVFQKQNCWDNW